MFKGHRYTLVLLTIALATLIGACSHPLEIIGNGDISASGTGGSNCALEDAPCANLVVNEYSTTYTAIPRAGFGFLSWSGCGNPLGDKCSFSVPSSAVNQFWGQTMPPLTAIFSPEVTLGALSGDFSESLDCEGTVSPPNPEVVFRFRESTAVAGENQKQCLGNTIFVDNSTGANYLVWLDILHINSENEVVSDEVDGSYPIREIYGNFADPFIVGKTYTLQGTAVSAGFFPISIEIIWVDIDANFNGFAQCIITESQSPIGQPTRRKNNRT